MPLDETLPQLEALAIGEALGVYRDDPVSNGCTSPFAREMGSHPVFRPISTGTRARGCELHSGSTSE
jgi:hypothetical protein